MRPMMRALPYDWPHAQRLAVPALFLVLWALGGCTSTPTFSRPIYEDPTLVVRLDSPLFQAEGESASPMAFPGLTADQLAVIVQAPTVQHDVSFLTYWVLRKPPEPEPLFSASEATLLSPHLVAALAKARSNELATFFLRRTRPDGISLITSGGLLLRGDQLILIVANVRAATATRQHVEHARDIPLSPLGEVDFRFVPGPHVTVLAGTDLQGIPSPPSVPVVSIAYGPLLASSPQARDSKSPLGAAPMLDDRTSTTEEKLRRLKTWREEGLITDDEYLQKRHDLLKHF